MSMYKEDIDKSNTAGNKLRRAIKEKSKNIVIDDYLNIELEKLQKAVDTKDYNLFLKTLTPIYIRFKINMPNVLYKILEDDTAFEKIGWGFILGLKGANKSIPKKSIIIDGEECIDFRTIAEMLGVHRSSVVRWFEAGKLKKANSDNIKKVYIKKSEVNEFIKRKD